MILLFQQHFFCPSRVFVVSASCRVCSRMIFCSTKIMLSLKDIFAGHYKIPIPEGQYVGCVIFALTSLVATVVYIYVHCNAKRRTGCTDDDVCNTDPDTTPIMKAQKLATETDSFLTYLRKLDKNNSVATTETATTIIPPHCRSIDFYLACRESKMVE